MKKSYLSFFLIIILISLVGCSNKNDTVKKETRTANSASDFKYKIMGTEEKYVGIEKYIGATKEVFIPEEIEGYPVKSIGIAAFSGSDIELVDIPDTVKMIWNKAFYKCEKLHTVNMGNGVEQLIDATFSGCKSLKNLTLSSKLSSVESKAFSGCTSLKKLHIPKSLDKWGMELFYGCPLTKLTFEEGIETIGSYGTFWTGGTLKTVTIPASVKKIGEYTFKSGLTDVYFEGDAPTNIGKKPFGEDAVIHCRKGTSGWDDTPLKEWYEIIKE